MIILETTLGQIKIALDTENTPNTASNFEQYVKDGFYDNTILHRVIKNFMVQGGGFEAGMKDKQSNPTIQHEGEKSKPNKRGTLAMARTGDPHSASSQFFINTVDNAFLNFKQASGDGWGYCVFAEVTDGMDVVDKLQAVTTTSRAGHQDVPETEIMITKAYIED